MTKYTDKKLEQMRDSYNKSGKSNSVPIDNIKMEWHEGYQYDDTYEGKNFKTWDSYQKALKRIYDDNKADREENPGTYTKTKATVTWKDGTQRTARIDLSDKEWDYNPNRESIGDYWKRDNLQDGKYVEGKGWEPIEGKFIKSRTGRDLSTGNDQEETSEYNVGDEVVANYNIEEPNFMDDDKVWIHAEEGKRGYVEDVDDDGYPTVRFYETNTATIVGKDEVSKTGKKLTTRTVTQVYVDDEDIRKAKESYLDKSNTPVRNSMGPGKGWHGERMRHRNAALKRRMR